MKEKLHVGFITTVSGRWPREVPRQRLAAYGAWLQEHFPAVDWIAFEDIIDSDARIGEAIETLRRGGADLVVMLYGAFTGDDVSAAVADALNVPLILWAPREPELNGGRLLANAMVALTMNSASLYRLGHVSHPVYGGLESAEATARISTLIQAYGVFKAMRHTLIGLFGYRPTAFYNSTFDEGLIRRTFGVRIEETDLKVVFDRMAAENAADVLNDRRNVEKRFHLDPSLPDEYRDNHARLYLALKALTAEQGYDYSILKCWPEMGNLKTTPCAVMGRLADEGTHIVCEGDMDAALALIAQNLITGEPNFITDMIDINEAENYLTFWHCGNAAPSLHEPTFDTVMGDHPLAGQGTAFRTTLKSGPVTISRLCNINGVYKLLLIRGTARATELYTPGCMVNVTVNTPVKDVLYGIIAHGIPHHYSIVWEDVADVMRQFAAILGLEVIEY